MQHDGPADKRVRRRFTWSASVAAVLLLALAGLTLAVRTTPLPLDSAALTWALDHRVPWATTIAVAVTTTGSGLPAYILAALSGLIACPQRRWIGDRDRRVGPARGGRCPPAPGDMARSGHARRSTSGSPAHTVLRSRPDTPPPLRWWPRCCARPRPAGSRGRRRLALQLVFLSWAVAVGLTRVYLAVHWMTDVVGGWLLAGGLSVLAYAVVLARRPTQRMLPV